MSRRPHDEHSRERLVDALLAQHLRETPSRMELRYAKAFAALDTATTPVRSAAIRVARAALVLATVGLLLLLIPQEPRASATLAQAVAYATRERESPLERRYEISVRMLGRQGRADRARGALPEIQLHGNWDMRGSESRLELRTQDGPTVIRADSAQGAWGQREGGVARRLTSPELWPRWIEEPDGSIAVERMDELLRLVQNSYEVAIAHAGNSSPAHLHGAMHLVAARRGIGTGPDAIELWIDIERDVVLEAQLRWKPVTRAEQRQGRPTRRPPSEQGEPLDDEAVGADGDDGYRVAKGALPLNPPLELTLRRVEPIAFPADHFRMPTN